MAATTSFIVRSADTATTPNKAEASYDLIVQGESGIMDITATIAPPRSPSQSAILMAGQLAVEGILLALLQRSRDHIGPGQKVDIRPL
jgi:crotonobetainyl-CoA:carnitine CoA-transferase CaiB-like acyl-CoA transferase